MARVFVWIGAALLCGAAWTAALDLKAWLLWPTAPGTVVEVVQGTEGTGAPVVAFTAADGSRVTYRSRLDTPIGDWKVGQAVSVRYDPADPSDALIPGRAASMALFLLGIGVFSIVLGTAATATEDLARRPAWVARDWPCERATIVGVVQRPGRFPRGPRWCPEVRGPGGESWLGPSLPFDPVRYLDGRGSAEIDVARDPANPERLWMDLRWLAAGYQHDPDRY